MEWMLMPLKRYADFSGRSRRMEFWMWQLAKFLVNIVLMTLFFALFSAAFASAASSKDPNTMLALGGGFLLFCMICMILGLAILIPDIAVMVRRLHDTNRSGWWILAPLGPYVLAFVLAGMAAAASGGGQDAGAMMGAIGIVAIVCILAALMLGVVLLVFFFLEGTKGPNNYGPDPKGPETGQVFS